MWAFGIVLHKMAVAYKPTAIAGYKYGTGPIPFRKQDWKKREGAAELQDLLQKCLEFDPQQRISAEEALICEKVMVFYFEFIFSANAIWTVK